ncbi:CPBP family glutamic-type intramembrane protease [Methanolobus chelungpuianus]|uniref:CAAX prenyl protease 2/Lysostaphin resistance protein A-like domain-containing protein n=1 Tax=Methanolobus chelungpuianus TaxID=502115 RepID=A0AAE3HBZ9_9EURY|nr:CPBP family glutamic-type intramembrane protease [Methanolobus chelungpuianus]MCQ6963288.1 hypothetical protein [Methanolobus chelungpuianus]
MNVRSMVDWNVFWSLFMVAELSMLAALPYAVSVSGDAIQEFGGSFPTVLATQIAQGTAFLLLSLFTGIFLGKKVGLKATLLESLFEGRGLPEGFNSSLKLSILLGLLVGTLIFATDRLVFSMFTEPLTVLLSSPPIEQRILYSFYAGIVEEIILRFFLVTLLVWISWKIKKNPDGSPTTTGFWLSILLVSTIYGFGYFLSLTSVTDYNAILPIAIIALGIISGSVFGWLYWKKGLEAAIIANLSASLMVFVILGSLF